MHWNHLWRTLDAIAILRGGVKTMRTAVVPAVAVLALTAHVSLAEYRVWTYTISTTGQESRCTAEFKGTEGNRAVLVTEDNRTVKPLIQGLSQEDRQYVARELARKQTGDPGPTPPSSAKPERQRSAYHEVPSGTADAAAKVLADGEHHVASVAWSPQDNLAAWREGDGSVMLYEVAKNKLDSLVAGGGDRRWFDCPIRFAADGKSLVGSHDMSIVIWDVGTLAVRQQFPPAANEHFDRAWPSPDGSQVAVVVHEEQTSNYRLEVADVATGHRRTVGRYPTQESRLEFGTFSPAGLEFALEIHVGEIERFEAVTWGPLPSIRCGTRAGLVEFKYSPNKNTLAAAHAGDRFVRIWDISQRSAVPVLRGTLPVGEGIADPHDLRSLSFSPDGRLLAVGHRASDGIGVSICDLDTCKIRHLLKAEEAKPFSPDGRVLVTGCFGSKDTLFLWDPASGAQLRSLPGAKQSVAAFSSDGKHLLTAGDGVPVRLWPMTAQSEAIQTAELHSAATDGRFRTIGRMQFSPDGSQLLAWGISDSDVGSVFEVATGSERCLLQKPFQLPVLKTVLTGPPNAGTVLGFGYERGGDSGRGGTVRHWDLQNGKCSTALPITRSPNCDVEPKSFWTQCTAVSRNGDLLAVGAIDRISNACAVITLSLPTLKPEHVFSEKTTEAWHGPCSLRFSADGKSLAALYKVPNEVRIWDLASEQQRSFPLDHGELFELLDNGKTIWCLSSRNCLQRWDVATGQMQSELSEKELAAPHGMRFERISLSPTGNVFATSDDRGTILVRDPTNGRTLQTLSGHKAAITVLTFSPDGRVLASGDRQGGMRLWKLGGPPAPPAATAVLTPNSPQKAEERKPTLAQPRRPSIARIVPWASFPVEGGPSSSGNVTKFSMTFRGDYSRLVSNTHAAGVPAGDERRLVLVNIADGSTVKSVSCYPIQHIACSSDGQLLAVVEGEEKERRTVTLFDTISLEKRGEWRGPVLDFEPSFVPSAPGLLVRVEDRHKENLCLFSVPDLRQTWLKRNGYVGSIVDVMGTTMLTTFNGIELGDVRSGVFRYTGKMNDLYTTASSRFPVKKVGGPLILTGEASFLFTVDDNRLAIANLSTKQIGDPGTTELDRIVSMAASPQHDCVAVLGETRDGWLVSVFRLE